MRAAIHPALRPIAAPALVLGVAAAALATGRALPDSLAGLKVYGPYFFLALGTAISLWFNRGRAFFALLSLLAGYAGLEYAMGAGSFAARAVFTGLAVFVPLNILLAVLLPERGVFHYRGYRCCCWEASKSFSPPGSPVPAASPCRAPPGNWRSTTGCSAPTRCRCSACC